MALDDANATLLTKQSELDAANAELDARGKAVADLEARVNAQHAALQAQQSALEAQQAELDAQTARIDALVGVRTDIIQDLTQALSRQGIPASVDPETGDIVLGSAVFFETGSFEIKEEGRLWLEAFVPVYL